MIDAFNAGNVREAREIHLHYLELMSELFLTTNPIPVKGALARMGLCQDEFRLPMTPCNAQQSARLESMLREYEFLKHGSAY